MAIKTVKYTETRTPTRSFWTGKVNGTNVKRVYKK